MREQLLTKNEKLIYPPVLSWYLTPLKLSRRSRCCKNYIGRVAQSERGGKPDETDGGRVAGPELSSYGYGLNPWILSEDILTISASKFKFQNKDNQSQILKRHYVFAYCCLCLCLPTRTYKSSLFCRKHFRYPLKYPWSEHQSPDIDKLWTRGIPSQAAIHLIHVKRKIINPLFFI